MGVKLDVKQLKEMNRAPERLVVGVILVRCTVGFCCYCDLRRQFFLREMNLFLKVSYPDVTHKSTITFYTHHFKTDFL